MTTVAGSRSGTRGMSIRPAPSCPRRDARLLRAVPVEPDPDHAVADDPVPVTGAADTGVPAGAFSPHSSQKPSGPYLPPHPGRTHCWVM
jgi:hypothetical protein